MENQGRTNGEGTITMADMQRALLDTSPVPPAPKREPVNVRKNVAELVAKQQAEDAAAELAYRQSKVGRDKAIRQRMRSM